MDRRKWLKDIVARDGTCPDLFPGYSCCECPIASKECTEEGALKLAKIELACMELLEEEVA